MKILFKNIFSAIIGLTLIIVIFGSLLSINKQPPKKVPLNELVQQINSDNIKTIEVDKDQVIAIQKDNVRLEAQKEQGGTFLEVLKNYGVSQDKINSLNVDVKNNENLSLLLSLLVNLVLPILFIGTLLWLTLRQAQRGNIQAMTFGKSLAKMVLPSKDKTKRLTFKDVAGLKEAKEELSEIVEFLKNPQKFTAIGAKVPKGVLLIGPPGTGKTLLARAVASEAEVPFFYTSGSEFVEMFVGVGASRIRDLFKTAVKNSPALIFIDELDAVGRSRGSGMGGGNDEREQTLNQILVEMDGFEANKGLIVLAATNRPDVLDSALLRPGRFDRRVTLSLPDIQEREQILKIHASNKPFEESVNFRVIGERTPGFSGADLENLLNEAAILAARQNKKIISQDDILSSIDKVLMGPERKSRVISPREKDITAYHEAGHAIIADKLPDADPVQKVTIIARGNAGGYTLKLPSEERNFHTKREFEADIAVALGGFVAEKIIFGEVSTGSSSDLQKATELAKRIVKEFGMSDILGPIHYSDMDRGHFYNDGLSANHSPETLEKIDKEIRTLIENGEKVAHQTITAHKDKFIELAEQLKIVETVEKAQFDAIMDGSYLTKSKEKKEVKEQKNEEKPTT